MTDRRRFLALNAAAPLPRGAALDRPLGINLYTLRDALSREPEKTCQALATPGIRRIKVREVSLREHAPCIRRAGLQPAYMFVDSGVITGDWPRTPGTGPVRGGPR